MSRVKFIRPSAAATLVVCHGYAAMREAYPDAPDEADTDIREDGTACHWLASEVWEGRYPEEGSLSPNFRVLDESMFDAVDMYHDVLRSWPARANVEMEIAINRIIEGMRGTPDAWAYDPATRTLYIADLKYGFRFVEVWENWQLICYAAGLLESLGIDGLAEQFVTVVFTIVQPRSNHRDGPVRHWRVKASDLRPQINILHNAAHAALASIAPPCTPNPGCGDCPGRHACVALQNSALTALEQSYAGLPLELPLPAVGDELRRLKEAAKRMEARITGLEEQAEHALRKGAVIPGWGLSPTYARETWQEGAAEKVMALGQYFGVNLAKPAKPVTPAQARKLIPTNIVAMFAHKPSTGVKLTKVDPFEAKKRFQQ